MIHTLLNVVYVLIAISMVVFILLQRGAGAQAGSGFGAGASGTVFGARGSANFLTSATKWLAALFFSLSLFMAWQASHKARQPADQAAQADLGLMSQLPATAKPVPANPVLPAAAPAATPAPVTAPIIAPAAPATAPPTPAPVAPNKGG